MVQVHIQDFNYWLDDKLSFAKLTSFSHSFGRRPLTFQPVKTFVKAEYSPTTFPADILMARTT